MSTDFATTPDLHRQLEGSNSTLPVATSAFNAGHVPEVAADARSNVREIDNKEIML